MAVQSPWPTPEIPETDLTSFVLRHAERLAGKPALIDGPSGRALTYGALAAGVERAAGGLAGRGFGRGDVLALHLPNLPEFPIALHAGLRAGGVVTLRQPALHGARARRPAAARTGADRGDRRPARGDRPRGGGGRRARCSSSASCSPATARRRAERPEPGDVALLLASSGTTGLPKLAELTHRALVANLVQTRRSRSRSGEDDRLLGLAPFFHSMGLRVRAPPRRSRAAPRSSRWRASSSRRCSARWPSTASPRRSWRRRCCRRLPTTRRRRRPVGAAPGRRRRRAGDRRARGGRRRPARRASSARATA